MRTTAHFFTLSWIVVAGGTPAVASVSLGPIENVASFSISVLGSPSGLRADDGLVVWERNPNTGSFNIEAYDFSNSQFIDIRSATSSSRSVFLPDVSGRNVVWVENNNFIANIRQINLDTLQITDITSETVVENSFPTIDGDTVVWTQIHNGFDVISATGPSYQPIPVSDDPTAFEGEHDISGRRVAYAYTNGAQRRIRVFDLDSASVILDRGVQGLGVSTPPRARIEGDILMWGDEASPLPVHVVDIQSNVELVSLPETRTVDISESLVVYWDRLAATLSAYEFSSGETSLLATEISDIPRNGLALDGNRLTWVENESGTAFLRSAIIIPEPTGIALLALAIPGLLDSRTRHRFADSIAR